MPCFQQIENTLTEKHLFPHLCKLIEVDGKSIFIS
jgi:hypothetical protein